MHGAIDVHTHILPPGWDDWAARFGGAGWPRLVGDPTAPCQLYLGETFNRKLGPDSFDAVRRIADMDAAGIERQVLSPPPPLFCYGVDRRGRGGVRPRAERQYRRRRRPGTPIASSARPRCRCSRPTSR